MNTTSIGRQAEQKAADYLIEQFGYKLLAQNWRTRTCEIDLVMESKDKSIIHFIEVKYRKNSYSGTGLESISKDKLKRMYNASLEWLEQNPHYSRHQPNISAVELKGTKLVISNFVPTISLD